MSKDYGMMIGCNDALMWVQNLTGVNDQIRDRVLNRMAYEFDKDIPVRPKLHKGVHGHKYDHYTCGNCGAGINLPVDRFCPNCGFSIATKDWQEKERKEFGECKFQCV